MSGIFVIEQIDAPLEGPRAIGPDGKWQPVHLQQGDLDGACGQYCLFMALMIHGLVSREDLLYQELVHGNSRIIKIFSKLAEYEKYFRNGLSLLDLSSTLKKSYPKKLKPTACDASGVEIRRFIEKNVYENSPVIVGISDGEMGHWVLVIGLEYSLNKDKSKGRLLRFLILDPGQPPSYVCAWNGVIEARGSGGKYPYTWYTQDESKVQFLGALAIKAFT